MATPDHNHAVIGMEAIRRKIHLYLEKPLAHSIYETRQLTHAAQKAGIVTQMGNQGHASKKPPETLPRSIGHFEEFFEACKKGDVAGTGSNFAYAGPLTEAVLLGNVAIRAGKKVQWDPKKIEVTNVPEANAFLRRDYREGWRLHPG